MENLMNSVVAQLGQIMDDFRDDDEKPESGKPAEDKKEGASNSEASKPEFAE
jgi:hypothetical protein